MPPSGNAVPRAISTSPLDRLRLRSQFDFPSRSWSLPAFENAQEAALTFTLFSRQLFTGKAALLLFAASATAGLSNFPNRLKTAAALSGSELLTPKESGRGRRIASPPAPEIFKT